MADSATEANSEAPYYPTTYSYAAIRIDPVAMVEHLNDVEALAAARLIRPKSYVVYIDCVSAECGVLLMPIDSDSVGLFALI